MALGPTVTLTFAGDDSPLRRAVKRVESSSARLGKTLAGIGGGLSKLSAGGLAVQTLSGAAGAMAQLAPVALLLPGALAAGGAAMATLKIATAGFSDALKSMSDPEAFAEAVKAMAPAARDTAVAIRDMQPQMKALKDEVQGRFFAGFADDAKALGTTYLPLLTSGLGGIASRMNEMARGGARALMDPAAVNDVNEVLRGTDGLLANMRGTLGNVVSGFLGLAGVGSTYLPALGSAIDGVTGRFKAWVDQGVESGRITELIDGAIQGFRDLGAIVGNIGSVIGSIFTGLGASGESFLAPLREGTAALAEFFASASAQTALAALGEAMRAAGVLIREVFLSALQSLAPVVAFLAPIVTSVATGLAAWAPVLGPAVVALGAMVLAVKAITAGIAIYNGVTTAVRAVTTAWTGVQWLLNAALSANPIGIVVVAIGALVAALIYAWNNSETFRSVVLSVWAAVKGGISAAVGWIKSALAWFGELPGRASAWFGGMRDAAVNRMQALVGWVRGIPGMILSGLGSLGSLLVGSGRALLEGLWRGIQGAIGWVKSKISGALSSIRNLFPFSPAKEGPFSGSGYTTHSGRALAEDFAAGITSGAGAVNAATSGLVGAASRPFASLPDVVKAGSVDRGTWQSLLDAGWKGRAGDGMEAVYRPGGGGGAQVAFVGNTTDALATAIQHMIRTGKIQIRAA